MNESMSIGSNDERRLFQHFIAQNDGPAFLRRARRLNEAIAAVHERCRQQREEWLLMPRLHIGRLHILVGDWENLCPLLREENHIELLRRLHAELAPKLRLLPERTTSAWRWRNALQAVIESNERFNARWQPFVEGLDFTEVNEKVDGYNRYYLLEKECVVSSPRIARLGFEPKQPMTARDVFQAWPLLPVPVLA
jgi:hypothetical protein